MKRAPIKTDLTANYVRTLFDYDPIDGFLRHRARHGVVTGAIAGTIGNHGYVSVKIHRRSYLAHRIVWLIVRGDWCDLDIDHINLDKRDNRWGNLRRATRSQNVANSMGRRHKKVGTMKGAFWNKTWNRWHAGIRDNGKNRHLGWFKTEQEAHLAYVEAARQVFGEFANSGIA